VDHQFSPKDNFYARFSDWFNDAVSSSLPTLPGIDIKHSARYPRALLARSANRTIPRPHYGTVFLDADKCPPLS
jgi:hypothetical protein